MSDPYSCNLDCGTMLMPCIKFFDIMIVFLLAVLLKRQMSEHQCLNLF